MLTRKFMTVREVADLAQVSEATVRHWIKEGGLRAINVGREFRIIPRDFEAFLERRATRAAPVLDADHGATLQDPSKGQTSAPGGSPPMQKGVGAADARDEVTKPRTNAKTSGDKPTRKVT